MLKSMTGYGRGQNTVDGRDITVEIKSVNHRFFECSVRLSRSYGFLEEKLKAFVHTQVFRGKVDISLSILTVETANTNVEINTMLAASYLDALRTLGHTLQLDDDITLSKLARFNDIFVLRKPPENEDALWSAVQPVAQQALDQFLAMRAAEGATLKQDLIAASARLLQYTEQVETLSPQVMEQYRDRLFQRISEVLQDRRIDEQRILTEVAIFADKTAVAEETVRLKSHISQLHEFFNQDQPVGRKLDFLVQEMNRETNTIGSKAQDLQIAKIVVEMKSDIEKIREQIQNIE